MQTQIPTQTRTTMRTVFAALEEMEIVTDSDWHRFALFSWSEYWSAHEAYGWHVHSPVMNALLGSLAESPQPLQLLAASKRRMTVAGSAQHVAPLPQVLAASAVVQTGLLIRVVEP